MKAQNTPMLFPQTERKAAITAEECPYCEGKKIAKSGVRKNKRGETQLYLCKNCGKKFTPLLTKHRTYPLRVILSAITLYNRMHTFEKVAEAISEKYGIAISARNVRNWVADFAEYTPYLRMRDFVEQKFDRREVIEETRMMHERIYDFKYHRAKTQLILDEDFKNAKFRPVQRFLDLVAGECPHQLFQNKDGQRASEHKGKFNMDGVRIVRRDNMASKNARMILQAVSNNKLRHEIVEEFMFVNDSVTVATEVPVLIDADDVGHFRDKLGFEVPIKLEDEEVITGHIDLVQIRNGFVHIMDYKPSARKEKPIVQLMIYALALSRLTALRLYNFKCAWFDQNDYFEFFPLHVVYKKKKKRKRR